MSSIKELHFDQDYQIKQAAILSKIFLTKEEED
jgi:hypothetical protein